MNWLDVERSRPPLRETEDRLFIEDRRQARAAWEAWDAEKQRRLAEMDRKLPAPESCVSALNMLSGMLVIGTLILAFAGLIAWVQS